jgi:hypothetical protein
MAGEADRSLVFQPVDVAVARTDPARAKHLEPLRRPPRELAALVKTKTGGNQSHA